MAINGPVRSEILRRFEKDSDAEWIKHNSVKENLDFTLVKH